MNAFLDVQVIGRTSGGNDIGRIALHAQSPCGDLFGLLLSPLLAVGFDNLLAAAEIAAAVPDRWRRGSICPFLPEQLAIVLSETIERAVDGRDVNMIAGYHRRRNYFPDNPLFPYFLTSLEIEAGEMMLVVAFAVGIGHV